LGDKTRKPLLTVGVPEVGAIVEPAVCQLYDSVPPSKSS
jgi:hypothetical protein